MPDQVSGIVERLFARASNDVVAAPLADRFACAYSEGRWTARRLDEEVLGFVESCEPDVRAAPGEEAGGAS